jgi:RHS repeat-associated protein
VDVLLDWWYYDDLGRVVDQYQRDNLFNWRRATYTYFADGQLDRMDRYTYTSSWTKLATTQWTYDGAGRIDDLKHFKADGTTLLAGYGYGFDAAGRMTSMDFSSDVRNNDAEDVTAFGYDRTNQLLSGDRSGTTSDEAYAYDGAGNRTAANGSTYTTSTNNRLTNDGTFTYTYDDEGNRLTKVRISGAAADDKTVEYQWDYRNRLEKVTFKRNDGTVTKRVEYYYDMFNRWTKRVVDPDGDTGSAATRTDRMIHDGQEAIIQDFTEYSDSHTFMHGPLPDMVIFDYHENELRIPLGDHLNTIRDVVAHDGTDWKIVNHVTIDSFGRRIDESDDTIEVFHGLGGRPYDEETGLQNHHHRWYDPATGRWISEDPVGFGGGHENLNVYVGNSPVNGIDPTGLLPPGWDAQQIAVWKARRFQEVSEIYAELGMEIPASVWESFGYEDWTKPNIPEDEWDSIGQSLSSMVDGSSAIGSYLAGDDVAAEFYADRAGETSLYTQVNDAPVYQTGVQIALGTSVLTTAAAVGILATQGVSAVIRVIRQPACFVAGTLVVLAPSHVEVVTSTDSRVRSEGTEPNNRLLLAMVLLVCATQVATCKTRRKRAEDESVSNRIPDRDESSVVRGPSGWATARDEVFGSEGPESDWEFAGAVELNRELVGGVHSSVTRRACKIRQCQGSRSFTSKLATLLALSAGLLFAALSFSKPNQDRVETPTASHTLASQLATAPIEAVRVGQRVVTLADTSGNRSSFETAVDPATWRHLRLEAVEVWPDGTRDVIEVETLQPPDWVAEAGAHVGAEVPLPLDLHEMGLPQDLKARVISNERCPRLDDGPGHVVLTTVSHLNPDVWQLDILDAEGNAKTIRPTGQHKFYSLTRDDWVMAKELGTGEKLRGLVGAARVCGLARVPGVHRVYNMTVESEHVYRVCAAGVLVHNNCPVALPDPNKLHHIFGKPGHNLGPLLGQFGGSQQAAYQAVQAAAQAAAQQQGLNGIVTTIVNVGGQTVRVTGNVINGVFRIGTFFM